MKCWHELPVCRKIFLSLLSCMLLSWLLSRTKPGSGGPHYLPASALILWGQLQTICTQAWDKVGCTRGQEVQTAWGLAQWPDLTVTQWTRSRQATQEKQLSSYIWHILQDVKFYLGQKTETIKSIWEMYKWGLCAVYFISPKSKHKCQGHRVFLSENVIQFSLLFHLADSR